MRLLDFILGRGRSFVEDHWWSHTTETGTLTIDIPPRWRITEKKSQLQIDTPDKDSNITISIGHRAGVSRESLKAHFYGLIPKSTPDSELQEIAHNDWVGLKQEFRGKLFSVTRKYCAVMACADPTFVIMLVNDRPIPFRKKQEEYSRMVASLKIGVAPNERQGLPAGPATR